MDAKLISARLQVYFWTIVIRLISESRLAQRCLQQIYQLNDAEIVSVIRIAFVCLGAGMLIGILLGFTGI